MLRVLYGWVSSSSISDTIVGLISSQQPSPLGCITHGLSWLPCWRARLQRQGRRSTKFSRQLDSFHVQGSTSSMWLQIFGLNRRGSAISSWFGSLDESFALICINELGWDLVGMVVPLHSWWFTKTCWNSELHCFHLYLRALISYFFNSKHSEPLFACFPLFFCKFF